MAPTPPPPPPRPLAPRPPPSRSPPPPRQPRASSRDRVPPGSPTTRAAAVPEACGDFHHPFLSHAILVAKGGGGGYQWEPGPGSRRPPSVAHLLPDTTDDDCALLSLRASLWQRATHKTPYPVPPQRCGVALGVWVEGCFAFWGIG